MTRTDVKKLESITGRTFRDTALLEQAMTHTSYANEAHTGHAGSNERLEYLGDAVLEMVSSEFLYSNYPDMSEGELTRLRASLVCEPTLAMDAREIDLPDCLLLGRGEELTGGRQRDSLISDALEALIGAVYLDGGLEAARSFIVRTVLNDIEHKRLFSDSKTILQECLQKKDGEEIRYVLVQAAGPDHDRLYTVKVKLGETVLGEGTGRSKKAAEQKAAYYALIKLKGIQDTCI